MIIQKIKDFINPPLLRGIGRCPECGTDLLMLINKSEKIPHLYICDKCYDDFWVDGHESLVGYGELLQFKIRRNLGLES